jgi:hypothetical protein
LGTGLYSGTKKNPKTGVTCWTTKLNLGVFLWVFQSIRKTQCLIHNAPLGENPKFMQNFRLRNSTLKGKILDTIFTWYLSLYSWLDLKGKNNFSNIAKFVCIGQEKISKTCVKNVSELCELGNSITPISKDLTLHRVVSGLCSSLREVMCYRHCKFALSCTQA